LHARVWTQVGDRTIELIKVKSYQTLAQSGTQNQAHLQRGVEIVNNLATATRSEFKEHELAKYLGARKRQKVTWHLAAAKVATQYRTKWTPTSPNKDKTKNRHNLTQRRHRKRSSNHQWIYLVNRDRGLGLRTLCYSLAFDNQTASRTDHMQQPSRRNQTHPQHPSIVQVRHCLRHSAEVICLLGLHILLVVQGRFLGQAMHGNSRQHYPSQPSHQVPSPSHEGSTWQTDEGHVRRTTSYHVATHSAGPTDSPTLCSDASRPPVSAVPTTFPQTQDDWALPAMELEADLEAEYAFWATPVPQ
jgi:hypothetical protein